MRSLRVTGPLDQKEDIKEVLEDLADEYTSFQVESEGDSAVEFSATVDSDKVDEVVDRLKGIKEIDVGDLSIRVMRQESLIRKGQPTRGPGTGISKEEVYSKAKRYRSFSKSDLALVALSAGVASYGLVLNNLALVIGAMMLAPILPPFVSGALSIAVGDRSLMTGALTAGLLSVGITTVVGFLSVIFLPVSVTPAMRLVASPGLPSVLLAVLVGSAASLSFATGSREQMAGVAVAIALVPPLAAVGVGLRMTNLSFVLRSGSVAAMNLASLLVSGFLTFRVMKFEPSTYYREKQAARLKYILPAVLLLTVILIAPGIYLNDSDLSAYSTDQELRDKIEEFFGEDLLAINERNGRTIVTVVGEHNKTEFYRMLGPEKNIKIQEVETAS